MGCLLIGLLLGLFADDPKPDASPAPKTRAIQDAKTPARSAPKRSRWERTVAIQGKLLEVNSGDKTLVLEVTQRTGTVDPGEADTLARLQAQLANAYRATNPLDRARQVQQAQIDIAKHQQSLVRTHDHHERVEFQAADDVEVRLAAPPPAYDDKGNPRKLSGRELNALKGRTGNWGYAAEWDALQPDQMLRVYVPKSEFDRLRPAARSPKEKEPPKEDKPLSPDKAAKPDKDPTPVRLTVVTIHVLGENRK